MSLEDIIKERIRRTGPIPVADYMALALTHPEYGYYMRKDPLGIQGDFITAPEISQVFGELIGAWLAAQWITMGQPKAALAELGPGRGTLMADALRATKHIGGFHESISVHLVEASPILKQKQWSALAGKHPDIHWHTHADELPAMPLLLIANEFFDALPIRQFIQTETGGQERMIGIGADDRLQFIHPTGTGIVMEYCEAGEQMARDIGRHINTHGGAALIIDYGYTGGTRGDTLQAIKSHQYHDVLCESGTADLTAHVGFAALKQAALAEGAAAYGTVTQENFLGHLGAGARTAKLCENATPPQKSAMLSALERLTSPDKMGDLFKVLCLTHPQHPKPEGF